MRHSTTGRLRSSTVEGKAALMTSRSVKGWVNGRPADLGQAGIAIVSVLLLLVAVGAVSAGIGAMSVFNIQVSQNLRTQAVARATAEQAMDTALVALAWEFRETRDLPGSIGAFRDLLPTSAEFAVAQYDYFPSVGVGNKPEAVIRITGNVLRGGAVIAQRTVAARVQGVIEATTTNRPGSGLGVGFVTNDDIVVTGGGTFLLGMHAGGNIDVNGTVVIGGFSYLAVGDCRLGGTATSVNCVEGPHPNVPAFDYEESRREMLLQLSGLTPEEYDTDTPAPACADLPNAVVAAAGSGRSNRPTIINAISDKTYCLSDGFYEVRGSIGNGALIGSDRSAVKLTADVNPTLSTAFDNEWGVRVAVGDIELAGSSPLRGRNEILARAGVALNKGVTTVTVESDEDGRALEYVKTFIGAGLDVAFTGVGGTTTAIAAVANRAFCQNGQGGGNFIGTVNVSGTFSGNARDFTELSLNSQLCGNSASGIEFNGKTVARLPDGMTLPETGNPSTETTFADLGIAVLSRRP